MSGAVDLDDCPDRKPRPARRTMCSCGRCAVCGHPKHTAIHGPIYGQPPGSRPYGHQFVPADREGRTP